MRNWMNEAATDTLTRPSQAHELRVFFNTGAQGRVRYFSAWLLAISGTDEIAYSVNYGEATFTLAPDWYIETTTRKRFLRGSKTTERIVYLPRALQTADIHNLLSLGDVLGVKANKQLDDLLANGAAVAIDEV
eukprot:TRINITY_DN1471_c0_g1_i2.p1 TRINITY_DN1471_c0_g1~~TRINITY_DN1471_c0_g1_i2.p1  ORF type:complete len:133 (+),score=27.63 TRINITY_DN1471_c0_g1_i2:571-969(+)